MTRNLQGNRASSAVLATALAVAMLAVAAMPVLGQDDHDHDHDHAAPSDPAVGGGDFTSAVTGVTWFVPEGYTLVTHGIPGAAEHAESYAHHAMFNFARPDGHELPVEEGQVLVEVGVNEADQLCLDGPATAATPDELITALLGYNVRLFPESAESYLGMDAAPTVTWSNGIEAGAVSMSMEGMTGEWSAWALDDDAVAWLFVGGPASGDFDELADVLATSISFEGDAASLDALYADFQLADPCSPLPAA